MKNILITISGPSGAGKSTLERLAEERLGIRRLISTTTRPKREGEVHGKDYFFVSPDSFDRDAMVESKEFNGHWYGLERSQLDGENEVFVLVVEPVGAAWYKAFAHTLNLHVISLYIDCPEGLVTQRLTQRLVDGEITGDQHSDRLQYYRDVERAMRHMPWFDYTLDSFGEGNQEGALNGLKEMIAWAKGVFLA